MAAPEICDGIDNDGDGGIDDGPILAFEDVDGDGRGDPAFPAVFATCASVPAGYAASGDDCDDGDEDVSPTDPEVCNGVDDDCDGLIDSPAAGGLCASCAIQDRADSTYLVCSGQDDSWTATRGECRAVGYELAVINDAGENTFLQQQATGTLYWWFDLEDPVGPGGVQWLLSNGDPAPYLNWEPGQPNSVPDRCGSDEPVVRDVLRLGLWRGPALLLRGRVHAEGLVRGRRRRRFR